MKGTKFGCGGTVWIGIGTLYALKEREVQKVLASQVAARKTETAKSPQQNYYSS
jgi:hypothetical protein